MKMSTVRSSTSLNMYVPKNKTAKQMRQKLIELEGEINKSTVIMENVSTPPSITDRGSRQKISRITTNLNSAISQLDLIHI